MLHVSYLDEEDHIQHDPVIDIESQESPDLDPVSIPNQKPKPKWAQKLLDAAGRGTEIQKTEEEQGPSIRMNMLHYLSQIRSLQNDAANFWVGAT